jgi:hypothetical protein
LLQRRYSHPVDKSTSARVWLSSWTFDLKLREQASVTGEGLIQ